MNPHCPLVTLTIEESDRLRALHLVRGEKVAVRLVGMRSAEAFYKAMARVPIHQFSAYTIRINLDRI
jgi:hypothetical protein